MTYTFSVFAGQLQCVDESSPANTTVWPSQRIASYGTNPSTQLAADLGCSVTDLVGLTDALAQLSPHVDQVAIRARDDTAEKIRKLVAPTGTGESADATN